MQIEQILPLIEYNVVMEDTISEIKDDVFSLMVFYSSLNQEIGHAYVGKKGKVYQVVAYTMTEEGKEDKSLIWADPEFNEYMNNLFDAQELAEIREEEQSQEFYLIVTQEEILEQLKKLYTEDIFIEDDTEELHYFPVALKDKGLLTLAKYAHLNDITIDESMDALVRMGHMIMTEHLKSQ